MDRHCEVGEIMWRFMLWYVSEINETEINETEISETEINETLESSEIL